MVRFKLVIDVEYGLFEEDSKEWLTANEDDRQAYKDNIISRMESLIDTVMGDDNYTIFVNLSEIGNKS